MASVGYFRRKANALLRLSCGVALLAAATPLHARAPQQISVTATTLDRALNQLASQTGTPIVSTEAGLPSIRVRPVSGPMSVERALARLLDGTGLRAVTAGPGFRIERTRVAQQRPPRPRPPRAPDVLASDDDIVVSASKQEVRLLRFPASLIVSIPQPARDPGTKGQTLDDFSRATPVLQNTELGPGRNRIFIRGIADSSFNGATQSTASVYFGDVQLVYSGPHPGLPLHDVERVEIMEGPQGTLYGAGAIGGIIRITPNPVDLGAHSANLTGGTTVVNGGDLGGDINGMVNLPIVQDRLGVRAVGYYTRQGGTIDDVTRGLRDVNTSETLGGRAAMRLDPGNGWSIDIGILGQRIRTADGQYAETNIGRMARATTIAQPYSSDLLIGRAVLTRRWDSGLVLTAATGLSVRSSLDAFDATGIVGSPMEALYQDARDGRLLTLEARMARSLPSGASWLMGATYLENRDIQNRTFGPPATPVDIIAVTNTTQSASGFGEATIPLTGRFAVTAGARLTYARTDGEPSSRPQSGEFVRGQSTTRIDPTVAASWLFAPRIAAFARLQTGYRTGGIAVARGIGRVADFSSDTIQMGEVGLRVERGGATGVALTSAVSYARWNNIQADLLNRRGSPYTLNIGDADIFAFELTGDWVPVRGLRASGAVLLTQNRFDGTNPATITGTNQQLPETPGFSGNTAIEYRWNIGGATEARLGASVRYVGKSVLGPGELLNIGQGGYAVVGATGGWRWGRFDYSLTVDNLTNSKANRFSFGNPFTFARRNETTPLEPLSVRFGIGIAL